MGVEFAAMPGRFDDFKALMAAMVDATQKDELGTLNYEWAISDDRQVGHVYETLPGLRRRDDPPGAFQC